MVKMGKRKYYLESSSIRTAGGKRLRELGSRSDCFTSAFVLFELMTQTDEEEKEFHKRKTLAANLVECGLHIEWLLPSQRVTAAFPVLMQSTDRNAADFWKVVECFVDSSCRRAFYHVLADRRFTDDFERLRQEHADILDGARRIGEAPSWSQEGDFIIEQHRPHATEQEKKVIRNRAADMLRDYRKACGYRSIVEAFAEQWARKHIPGATQRDVKRTADSYDGSIDLFLEGFSVAVMKCKLTGHNIGGNDFADLLHLMYLREGNVLVSEDALFTATASEIGISVKRIQELATPSVMQAT